MWNKLLELYPIPNSYEIRTEYPQFKWNIKIIDNHKANFNVELENNNVDGVDNNDIYENCTDYIFDKPFQAECMVSNFSVFFVSKLQRIN